MIAASEHFTNLTSLRIDMANVTSNGINAAVTAMGERIVELESYADTWNKNYLSGEVIETITSLCPNLKHFAYSCDGGYCNNYNHSLDGVTGDRVVSLVEGCRCLQSLELFGARNVKQSHFLQIANLVANDLDGYALRKIVIGYSEPDKKVVSDPFDIQTLLAEYTFLEVEDKFVQPRLENGFFFTEQKDLVKEAAKKERQNEMKQAIEDARRRREEAVSRFGF